MDHTGFCTRYQINRSHPRYATVPADPANAQFPLKKIPHTARRGRIALLSLSWEFLNRQACYSNSLVPPSSPLLPDFYVAPDLKSRSVSTTPVAQVCNLRPRDNGCNQVVASTRCVRSLFHHAQPSRGAHATVSPQRPSVTAPARPWQSGIGRLTVNLRPASARCPPRCLWLRTRKLDTIRMNRSTNLAARLT